MKLIEPEAHKHKYDKEVSESHILYDHRNVSNEMPEPGVAGKDKIKLLVCECGSKLAIDLERTKA